MLGVVACVLAVVCKRMQQLPTSLGPAVHRGKNTTHKSTTLEELGKRIQHCCATLRWSRNKRNVGSCWLNSLTGFKLCATTSNNMQQGVQTDATCNIQQCCVRLHAALYLNKLSRLYAEFRLTAENRNHAGNLLSLRTWKFQRLLELISVSFYLCNLCLCEFLYRFCWMKMI